MAEVVLLFLSMVTLLGFPPTKADYLAHICPNTTVFTPNSTFQTYRTQLLSTLVSNANRKTRFYQTTAADQISKETVEGLFLCRGDVSTDACEDCVDTAASEVVQKCPVEKQVVIWYDECMVHYSNKSFLSTGAQSPGVFMWNVANLTQVEDNRTAQFNQVLTNVTDKLVLAVINAAEKFATRKEIFTDLITLYTLGQCTQDLSTADCEDCLRGAIAQFQFCCSGKQGGRVLYPSCNIRYEVYPFYSTQAIRTDDIPPPPAPVAPPPPAPVAPPPPAPVATVRKGKNKLSSIVIPSILAPVALCVLVVVVARCFIRKLKRAKRQQNEAENDMTTVESLQFDLGTIEAATKKFSADNMLGEDGFGQVFKVQILSSFQARRRRGRCCYFLGFLVGT